MQEWQSPAGAIAIVLWLLIIFSGAFGCGITREVTLPNGYICNVDKFIWIDHPDIMGDVVSDVEVLDVHDHIVFGSRRDYWDDKFVGYFILDTQLQIVWLTPDYAQWSEQLAELGIKDQNLRWPGVNFNGPSIWSVMTPLSISSCMILGLVWFIRRVLRQRRQILQDPFDRL